MLPEAQEVECQCGAVLFERNKTCIVHIHYQIHSMTPYLSGSQTIRAAIEFQGYCGRCGVEQEMKFISEA